MKILDIAAFNEVRCAFFRKLRLERENQAPTVRLRRLNARTARPRWK